MKTLRYILLAVLLGFNLVSCDPPAISDEVNVEKVERVSITDGQNSGGETDPED